MKSFKTLISEVAQPRSPEEQAFKDMHTYEVIGHPIALDHQFTGEIAKPNAARPADQEGSANYDTSYAYGMKKVMDKIMGEEAQLDELSKKTLGNYIKKSAADMSSKDSLDMHKGAMKRYKGIVKATDRLTKESTDLTENPQEEIPMMSQQLDFIAMAAKAIKASLSKGGDPEEWYQNKLATAHEAIKSLHANIASDVTEGKMADRDALAKAGEVSKDGKKSVTLKKAPWDKNEALVGGQKELDHDKDGDIDGADFAALRAKKKAKTEASCNTPKKMKEEVELDEAGPKIKGDSLKIQRAKDAEHNAAMGRTKTGRKKPERAMTSTQKSLASMRKEEAELDETLDEAFKAGIVKFNDGKQVVIKKQDADLLNTMLKDLSPASRKSMTKVAMTDNAGFEEILGFAREAL